MRSKRLALPLFIIVGFPKCGTTTLFNWLCQHPDITPPPKKELYYFNTNEYFRLDYSSIFKGLSGEATPNYIYSIDNLVRIKETTPNTKIICLLRDPIDRAWSHYNMYLQTGREDKPFLTQCIKNLESEPATLYLIRYEPYLKMLRRVFPDAWVSWMENLDRDFPKILDFLNLKRFEPNKEYKNVGNYPPLDQTTRRFLEYKYYGHGLYNP